MNCFLVAVSTDLLRPYDPVQPSLDHSCRYHSYSLHTLNMKMCLELLEGTLDEKVVWFMPTSFNFWLMPIGFGCFRLYIGAEIDMVSLPL